TEEILAIKEKNGETKTDESNPVPVPSIETPPPFKGLPAPTQEEEDTPNPPADKPADEGKE
ncbi:MAG: hypothetical protein K2M11_00545, partial [Paramuribaculum sp.]|nr:hypothetical protein [Paramuribaculum sp.]